MVKNQYFKKVQNKPVHGILNEIPYPVSKFPCQPSLLTPGSLSFPRIPTFASLLSFFYHFTYEDKLEKLIIGKGKIISNFACN